MLNQISCGVARSVDEANAVSPGFKEGNGSGPALLWFEINTA